MTRNEYHAIGLRGQGKRETHISYRDHARKRIVIDKVTYDPKLAWVKSKWALVEGLCVVGLYIIALFASAGRV